MKWPCHNRPEVEWCDYDRKQQRVHGGGFMGHTCARPLAYVARPLAAHFELRAVVVLDGRPYVLVLAGMDRAELDAHWRRLAVRLPAPLMSTEWSIC